MTAQRKAIFDLDPAAAIADSDALPLAQPGPEDAVPTAFATIGQIAEHVRGALPTDLARLTEQSALMLESITTLAPPAESQDEGRWYVPAGATGAWFGHAGEIAVRRDGAWLFVPARRGLSARIVDLGRNGTFDGAGAWKLGLVDTPSGADVQIEALEAVVGLSSASVAASIEVPAGSMVLGVATRVVALITGPSAVQVGFAGNPTALLADAGRFIGVAEKRAMVLPLATASPVVVTAVGNPFTAGVLRVVVTVLRLTPPGEDWAPHPETQRILDRWIELGVPASDEFGVRVDRVIRRSIDAGILDIVDSLPVYLVHDPLAALVDWRDPEGDLQVPVNSPAFTAFLGYQFANTKSVDTGFNAGVGEHAFTALDHTYGVLTTTSNQSPGYAYGTDYHAILPRDAAGPDAWVGRDNTNNVDTTPRGDDASIGPGIHSHTRRGSGTEYLLHKDGEFVAEVSRTGSTIQDETFRAGHRPGSGTHSAERLGMCWAGGAFSEEQHAVWNDIWAEFMSDVGSELPPLAWAIKCGGIEDDRVHITFDCDPSPSVSVQLFSDEELTELVDSATPVASTGAPTTSTRYVHFASFVVEGLTAATRYWYAPVIRGELQPGLARTFMTAPAAGAPAAFSILAGSCCDLLLNGTADALTFRAMAQEEGILQFNHDGDLGYANIVFLSAPRFRRSGLRMCMKTPLFDELLASTAFSYIWGDHDAFGGNDTHLDKVMPEEGVTVAMGMAEGRRVYRECVPHHPFVQVVAGEADLEKVVLMQVQDLGQVRFITPDWYSQARYETGTPTALGTGADGSWDQFSALCAAITSAPGDGMKRVVIRVARSLVGAVGGGLPVHWADELTALWDFIRDANVAVSFEAGDPHQSLAFSDLDYSTAQDVKLSGFIASPLWRGTCLHDEMDVSWFGDFVGNDTSPKQYCRVDFGTDAEYVVTAKGSPFDPETGAATELWTVDSRDNPREVQFTGAPVSVAAGGSYALHLERSGCEVVDGCTVQYSVSGGGPSGTITFKPNRTTASVMLTAPGSPASLTATLSSPVRCALGAATTIGITVT